MKKGSLHGSVRIFLLAAIPVFVFASAVPAANSAPEMTWDVVFKIERINECLDIVDEFVENENREQAQSPTAMIRGMLQGGDWIDRNRAVVIGVKVEGPQHKTAALIPFRRPNETFQGMFNASAGPDYYLLSLPPGQPVAFSTEQETYLAAASKIMADRTLNMEFYVNQLLAKSEGRIRDMLLDLQNKQNPADKEKSGFTPEEVRAMVEDMLDAASNLETLSIGFDLTRNAVSASMEALAVKGSQLEGLFSPKTRQTVFNNYNPSHQVNFKVGQFDVNGMVEFFDRIFGKSYEKMGLDFRQLSSIAVYFTGESAGGMTYGSGGAGIESMAVLKEPSKSPEFFDSVYIPWLKDYSDNIRKLAEEQTGNKMEPLYRRSKDSDLSGHRVVGLDLYIPDSMIGPKSAPNTGPGQGGQVYPMRMTVVDNLLLTAPDDQRLAQLIELSKNLKKGPLNGPLGRFDIDMAAYFNALKDAVPGLDSPGPMPDLGRIGYTFDLADGRMSLDSTLKIKDLKNMVAYFKTLSPSGQTVSTTERSDDTRVAETPASKTESPARQIPPKPAVDEKTVKKPVKREEPVRKDFDYWMDKGGLVAAYGNDQAAVKYYRKAIELEPNKSDAYFGLGVSLGELGQYQQAMEALNKAIQLNAEKPVYYYARGRVHILSGHPEQSFEDMGKAADLGNLDAIDYLKKKGEIR